MRTVARQRRTQRSDRYFIHGVSHHLGLDVHDPGDRHPAAQDQHGRSPSSPESNIPEENLGVRTRRRHPRNQGQGIQILTARLPRGADEIEKIMAEGAEARAQAPAATVVEKKTIRFPNSLHSLKEKK